MERNPGGHAQPPKNPKFETGLSLFCTLWLASLTLYQFESSYHIGRLRFNPCAAGAVYIYIYMACSFKHALDQCKYHLIDIIDFRRYLVNAII